MQRTGALVDDLLALDLNVGEEPGALSLAAMSAPQIIALLDRTESHFADVRRTYCRHDQGGEETGQTQAIDDLLFFGRAEINQSRERIEHAMSDGGPLRIVAAAGDALRRLTAAALSLEQAIASLEQRPVPARVTWDLEIALLIRQLYARLRREVVGPGRNPGEGPRPLLERFVDHYDKVRLAGVYRYLRFEDRIHLATVFRTARIWLDQGDEADPTEGEQLAQELRNLVELLRLVNNRPELVEHDRRVLDLLWTEIDTPRHPSDGLPVPLLEELETLMGLDVELDQLLNGDAPPAPTELRPCIERLRGRLGAAGPIFDP